MAKLIKENYNEELELLKAPKKTKTDDVDLSQEFKNAQKEWAQDRLDRTKGDTITVQTKNKEIYTLENTEKAIDEFLDKTGESVVKIVDRDINKYPDFVGGHRVHYTPSTSIIDGYTIDKKKTFYNINLRLFKDMEEPLKEIAKRKNKSVNDLILSCLDELIKNN